MADEAKPAVRSTVKPRRRIVPVSARPGGPSEPPQQKDPPTIRVYGDLVDRVTAIPSSLMAILLGVGRLEDDRSVLVPYVELKLGGAPREGGGAAEPLFAGTTTFENAAFLLADLSGDFRQACEQLAEISKGGIQPEAVRIAQAVRYLDRAQKQLTACSITLKTLTTQAARPSGDGSTD